MQQPCARQEGLVVRELPDEVLVYDLKSNRAHCLNHTAALVWRYCDGRRTAAQLAQAVAHELQTPFDEQAVWLALVQLEKCQLLHERIAHQAYLSRRQLVQRLSIAALLPAIISINAPTAFAQASCASDGQSCASIPCCAGLVCNDGLCCDGLPSGAPCTSSAQCCSGICVEGFCA